jgi:enoyl-CoA hydratase
VFFFMAEAPVPSEPAEQLIRVAIDGDVATVVLNRPDQLNPLDKRTIQALSRIVAEIDEDPRVSIVVLRGAGRAFSAGGDLEGYMELYRAPDEFTAFLRAFNGLLEAIERSSKIYIAIVHGHCVAGGVELMLACDIVLAAHEARIADGHLNFGQLPGAGGSQRLPRAVGHLRAKYLLMTGRGVGGVEAEQMGLVTKSFPLSELDHALDELLAELLAKSPLGLRGAKYLVNTGHLNARDAALELELQFVKNYATTSHDAYEGLSAFAEKRAPRMKGK